MRPIGSLKYERLNPRTARGVRGAEREQGGAIELVERAFVDSATANGVMGFKVMWAHLRLTLQDAERQGLSGKHSVSDLESRLAATTRFIWLRRRNHTLQAISLTKALQSGAWRSATEAEFRGRYVYDFPGITWRIAELRRQDESWQAFYDRHAVVPFVLYYEDCLEDMSGTIRRIAEWLEVPGDFAVEGSKEFQRQGGQLNEQWLLRYTRDSSSAIQVAAALARAGVSRDWWVSCVLGRLRVSV